MEAFNRMRNHPLFGVLLGLMVLMTISYGAQMTYRAVRADLAASVAEQVPHGTATEVDFIASCLAYAERNGMDDDACDPFTDAEWAFMLGGNPVKGESEPLTDWQYNVSRDGVFITGPGRTRIWVPTDRSLCPQIIAGPDMTEGACPTWVPNE